MGELGAFVLARLAEDEQRLAEGELPYLDEAERRGRLRIIRTDDGKGLLLLSGQVPQEHVPVPFHEKAEFIRREVNDQQDENTLKMLASAYETHSDWLEEWRMG
ncbi:MAG TPA: hypothetical protein VK887_09310 [Pseudonocardiaceae bacterium]|nr:hypothetical protein [Pseudonocardiaceae bacterium]